MSHFVKKASIRFDFFHGDRIWYNQTSAVSHVKDSMLFFSGDQTFESSSPQFCSPSFNVSPRPALSFELVECVSFHGGKW
jgi:hypothetical protein